MILRLLIFVAAGFILFKLLTGDKRKKEVKQDKQKEKMAASGQMVKDPVCGTYVSKDGDIRVKEGDDILCFCSYDCRDKYLKRIGAEKPAPDSGGSNDNSTQGSEDESAS
jgi:hypothetical protein